MAGKFNFKWVDFQFAGISPIFLLVYLIQVNIISGIEIVDRFFSVPREPLLP